MNIEGRLVYSGRTLVCTCRQDGDIAVLRFCGVMTRQDLGLANEMVCQLAEMDSRFLVVDLSDVPVVDEFGQGMLLAIIGIADGIGLRSAAVVAPTSINHREIVGCLHGSVPIYGSLDEYRDAVILAPHDGSATRH